MTTDVTEGIAVPPSTEGERERFEVTDDQSLAWCLRKVSTARSRMAEHATDAEAMRKKLREELAGIDAWLDHVTAEDRRTVERMEGLAVDFLARLQFEDIEAGREPKVKSRSTPWGAVKSRALQPDYERDEDTLREWAVANQYIRPAEPQIDWSAIKEATVVKGERLVLPGGEIVPGIRVAPKPRKYEVTTA